MPTSSVSEVYAYKVCTDEVYTYEVYAYKVYTDEVCTDEVYTYEVYTDEVYTYKVYTYKVYTDEVYTYKVYTDEVCALWRLCLVMLTPCEVSPSRSALRGLCLRDFSFEVCTP